MRVRVALAAVAVLGARPVAAQFDSIMSGSFGSFFVKNASGSEVRCAFRLDNAKWSAWFTLGADAEFIRYADKPGETLRLFCASPVERMAYRLEQDQRYVLLPRPEGPLRLVRVIPR